MVFSTRFHGRWRRCGLLATALCLLAPATPRAQPDLDARIAAAFHASYNLEHDTALAAAREAVAAAPNESRAHRSLASILWLHALFHRGAVTVDHYMGGMTRSRLKLEKPPAAVVEEFQKALMRATELAEAHHKQAPDDVATLHDLAAVYGLHASWTASVEGRLRSALGSARRAYNAAEEVLERDPSRVGAGTIVGTYRYAVAGLGMATRMLAYVAGFGGDKDRGIALIEAASRVPESRFEARTALVLIYSREGRHDDAYRLLGEMALEYPKNRLLILEQGAAAIRAGKAAAAEELLTRGLDALDRDNRRKMPGERALWLYKRGVARVSLNRRPAAEADLQAALQQSPQPWVQGRVHLELGKLSDLAGRRADAVAKYLMARDLGESSNDPASVSDALRLIRQPFVLNASGG